MFFLVDLVYSFVLLDISSAVKRDAEEIINPTHRRRKW
jgi:hypothetical protein